MVDEDFGKSKKKESKKKKKDTKSQRGRDSDSESKSSKQKSCGCSKSTDRCEKTSANTARKLAHTWESMKQTNASTTRSTKVGDPEKHARS